MAVNPNLPSRLPPLHTPLFIGHLQNSGIPAIDQANKGKVDPSSFIMSPPWQMFFSNLTASGQLPISGGGLTIEATSPQIQGSGLGAAGNAPLQIDGSNTVDGRIVLTPGPVSTTPGASVSSVFTQAQVQNQPAFIVQDYGSGSGGTNDLIHILDQSGNIQFAITGGGVAVGAGPGPFGVAIQGVIKWGTLTASGTGPLIDASSATVIFQIHGPNSTDGRIVLVPGNVSGGAGSNKSSVYTQAQVQNQPALIVQDYSGAGTNNLFAILSASGAVEFSVAGGGVASPQTWSVYFGGQPSFSQGATGTGSASLGSNCPAVTVGAPNTWLKFLGPSGQQLFVPAWE